MCQGRTLAGSHVARLGDVGSGPASDKLLETPSGWTEAAACESCGEKTFDLEVEKCALCGHTDKLFDCAQCGRSEWLSNMDSFEDPDSRQISFVCGRCVRDAEMGDFLLSGARYAS